MRITAENTSTLFQKMGTGPTIVLLHGWGCDWQIWSPLIPTLTDTYQVVTPDLPGFGGSNTDDISSWNSEKYVRWFEQFIDQVLPQTEFVLVGHSLGGKIASLFTANSRLKNRVKKLVIVDASGVPLELSPQQQLQKHMLKLIPGFLKSLLPEKIKLSLLQSTNSSTDYAQADAKHKKLLQTLIAEDIRSQLPAITTETHVFWGAEDKDTPLNHGRQFKELIPQSTLHLFNTGHFPFLEKPKEFLLELKAIL